MWEIGTARSRRMGVTRQQTVERIVKAGLAAMPVFVVALFLL